MYNCTSLNGFLICYISYRLKFVSKELYRHLLVSAHCLCELKILVKYRHIFMKKNAISRSNAKHAFSCKIKIKSKERLFHDSNFILGFIEFKIDQKKGAITWRTGLY